MPLKRTLLIVPSCEDSCEGTVMETLTGSAESMHEASGCLFAPDRWFLIVDSCSSHVGVASMTCLLSLPSSWEMAVSEACLSPVASIACSKHSYVCLDLSAVAAWPSFDTSSLLYVECYMFMQELYTMN